tara:strand:+ start:575 stop:703 length:129 start_codon:yes stop_codon:yes gene_type:complete
MEAILQQMLRAKNNYRTKILKEVKCSFKDFRFKAEGGKRNNQ